MTTQFTGSIRRASLVLAAVLTAVGAVGCGAGDGADDPAGEGQAVVEISGAVYHPFTGLAMPVQLVASSGPDACDGPVEESEAVMPFGHFKFTPAAAGDYCVRMVVNGLDPIDGAHESPVYSVDPSASGMATFNMIWASPEEDAPDPGPDPISKGGIDGALEPSNSAITVTLYKYDGMEQRGSGSFTGSYTLSDPSAAGDAYITVATSTEASDVSDGQYSLHASASGTWPDVDLDVSE